MTEQDRRAIEALAEAVPVAVCLVETDTTSFLVRFSNDLARARFGEVLEVGREVDMVFPPDVVDGNVADAVRRADTDAAPEHFRLRRVDGDYAGVPGDAVSVHRLDAGLVALLSEASGTDWQRSEFHAVVDSALEAILTKNLDGTILSWNGAASKLYGYTEAEVVGRPITLLLPGDRQDEVAGIIERLRRGERIREFETVRVCKDGTTVDVSLTITPVRGIGGAVVGAATIARDVTERKRAEQRMRLAAIVDATFDPVLSVDLAGRIITWNAAAERLFGYSADEMIDSPVDAIMGSTPVPALMGPRKATAVPGAAEPFDLSLRSKSGDEVMVEASISPILNEDGTLRASAVVLRDITSQRRLEERLRQKQKMEAIGSLASGVAHDFNNVLSVIRSASGLLASDVRDPSSRELIAEIDRAAVHASELTAQLLAFGRQQLLRPQPTSLEELLVPTLGMVRNLVSAHVQIRQSFAGGLPEILVDRTQLTQVVMNLCANAGQAMPDGGVLTVRTRLGAPSAFDDAVRRQGGGALPSHVVLEVSDTGVGMDDETRAHIFDPFYTTKETGTGLGLATVHGIVEQSGGHIEVKSAPGEGTTFRLYFPLAGDAVEDAPSVRGPEPPKGAETVLIADDSPALRMVFSKVVESAGYTVLTASDGLEALDVAARHDGPIHLLLSDVVMPGLGGRELYEQLKVTHPDLRVVFSSGYAADDVLRHGIATGQFDYIQKPSTNEALLAQLRATLDRV